MYIYNVTLNVDDEIHEDWLQWMKETHIPDVMATGMFISNRILQVMADDPEGTTYSIQYEVRDLDTLKLYQEVYAQKLQKEHTDRYEGHFAAFRTILRVEHDHNEASNQ